MREDRGVACIVLRKHREQPVLLLLRAFGEFEGRWCFVAGRVEGGETPVRAAARELEEETGIVARTEPLLRTPAGDSLELHVFVARVRDPSPRLNREHSEARWFSFEEANRLLPLPAQRHALRVARAAGEGTELRRAGASDAAALLAIRRDAILELAAPEMGAEAAKKWAGAADPDRVASAIRTHEVWLAERNAAPVAWVERDQGRVEAIYVHPAHARTGLGSLLLDHVELGMAAEGHLHATLEASSNAEPFHRARGYVAEAGLLSDGSRRMRKPLTDRSAQIEEALPDGSGGVPNTQRSER